MINNMQIEDVNMIIDKAKLKKDGVYSHKGILYRVHNGATRHLAQHGKIYERYGAFVVEIGNYKYISDAKKKLMKI
jgi:hypothetical protein